jgi:EAL domain-containing protein (putative c-di-GMP-specific phosphodiesterase class I)
MVLSFRPVVDLASGRIVGEEAVASSHLAVEDACRHACVRSGQTSTPWSVWVDFAWPDPERVAAALQRTGLPAEQLVAQLSETALFRRGVYDGMLELKELGVQIAVRRHDACGPELRTLRGLPIDILRFSASDPAPHLVERGHDLGLVMHADDVDDAATAIRLLRRDCDLAQGALFVDAQVPVARPLASGVAH